MPDTLPGVYAPRIPFDFAFVFPVVYCDGSDSTGKTYRVVVATADLGFTGGTHFGRLTYHERTYAELDSPADTIPNNLATLTALATRFAEQEIAWITGTYDRSYWGILDWRPDGTADEITWTYRKDDVSTRIVTEAANGDPEELHHYFETCMPEEASEDCLAPTDISVVIDVTCLTTQSPRPFRVTKRTLRICKDGRISFPGSPTTTSQGCCNCP
jgi:hypothetical protein